MLILWVEVRVNALGVAMVLTSLLVDFRKGCYVGQENVVRTYHTGMIRKRTIPVQLDLVSSGG